MSAEHKASRDLFRTVDDRVVFEGDPDARFLLARAGDPIPDGYSESGGKGAAKEADKPADKAVRSATNK